MLKIYTGFTKTTPISEGMKAKCAEMNWEMPMVSWPRFVDYIWTNGKKKGKEYVKLFCDLFLNTTDPSRRLERHVVLTEIVWDEGVDACIVVDELFCAVAGSTFIPLSIQVCL